MCTADSESTSLLWQPDLKSARTETRFYKMDKHKLETREDKHLVDVLIYVFSNLS